MEHYVTLFDGLFLPQGLTLHSSMERHIRNYTLWILCVDVESYNVLSILKLPNVNLLNLVDLESADLIRVKSERSKGEYCWTLTPFSVRFVLEADPTISRVTYIDADLWFRKDPSPIFYEFDLSGKAVLITDHDYSAEYDQSYTAGQFCVQFMIFRRNGGEIVRKWWEQRCIEWCYARSEDGKFGDQKYLDKWPDLFDDHIHILNKKELILAPWNATRFPYGNSIIWHFHGLRIININNHKIQMLLGFYPLPTVVINYIYEPYLMDFKNSLSILSNCNISIQVQSKQSIFHTVYLRIKFIFSQTWRLLINRRKTFSL